MTQVRFRSGCAKYPDLAMLLAYAGESDPFDPPTNIIVLDDAPSQAEWGMENLDDVFVDICTFRSGAMDRPAFVCVSEEGKVWFQLQQRVVEDIPGTGLSKPTSLKLGYIGGIRQLGDDLYAFGYAGQIYRRSGADKWDGFDHGILGTPRAEFDISAMCLTGDTFYAVTKMGGKGRIYSRTGDMWTPERNPAGEWLNSVAADQDGTVWICGRNGTLLKGNAASGFTMVGDPECNEELLSVALFRGGVWLSSATSLYTWCSGRLSKVNTDIVPGIRSANRLQAVDDVLWSFGYDDVLRFDGDKWTRFICPGTEPFPGQGTK